MYFSVKYEKPKKNPRCLKKPRKTQGPRKTPSPRLDHKTQDLGIKPKEWQCCAEPNKQKSPRPKNRALHHLGISQWALDRSSLDAKVF